MHDHRNLVTKVLLFAFCMVPLTPLLHAAPRGHRPRVHASVNSPQWKKRFAQELSAHITKAGVTYRKNLPSSSRIVHNHSSETVYLESRHNGIAHFVVVPKEPAREHVARKFRGLIRRDDIEIVLQHMQRAESIAQQLGIKNPDIWITPESRTSIGQLRINIQGNNLGKEQAPSDQEKRALAPVLQQHRKRLLEERSVGLKKIGAIFANIASKKDRRGHLIVAETSSVVAFLDRTDAEHPSYNPQYHTDLGARHIPPEKRAHILVIPKTPREHITQKLGQKIRMSDLTSTLELLKAAERIAKTLAIKNPDVWLNAESRVGVGYLHAHIAGEKLRTKIYSSSRL